MSTTPPLLNVAAGLLIGADGRLLLGQRPAGKAYAGWWELPGGKLEAGETPLQALARELDEELAITVTEATPWVTHTHVYPHATVRLNFCRVTGWTGEPRGAEGQRLAWVDASQAPADIEAYLGDGELLPAAFPPLAWLNVPDTYAITDIRHPDELPDFLGRLDAALARGLRLVQLRAPNWFEGPASRSLHAAFAQMLARTRAAGARLLVNSQHPQAWWLEADGVHLRSIDLPLLRPALRPEAWIGVSAHNASQLERARALGANFAVLGHVLATESHPGDAPLGWEAFARLNEEAGLPVFALGGQSEAQRGVARAHGAHGIAGIRGILGA